MDTSAPAQGRCPAAGEPARSRARACSPGSSAQRNHRETKHGPWRGAALGPGPERAPRAPTAGVQPGRGGAPEAPRARPSSKCFRTCHPSPPRSIFPSRRGRGTRARTGGRSWGGQRRAMAGVRRGPAATSRRPPPPPGPQLPPRCPCPPRAPLPRALPPPLAGGGPGGGEGGGGGTIT